MDIFLLKERIRLSDWDENLINDIIKSNNDNIYIYALEKIDCPVDLILDLWQAHNPKIRELICYHPNTPLKIIVRILEKEKNKKIKDIAQKTIALRRSNEE